MIDRRGDRTHILVGTSTLLPVAMLREVIAARREGRLPAGYVYLPESQTEDFELTLAAKTLGWRRSPRTAATPITDVMPTWKMLWHQRLRWMLGGVEDLRRYGWTKTTLPFHVRRAWILFGLACHVLFYATLAATWASSGTVVMSLPWVLLTAVFIIDRVAGVRSQGSGRMAVRRAARPRNPLQHVRPGRLRHRALQGFPRCLHLARDLKGNSRHVRSAIVLARGDRRDRHLPRRRGDLGTAQDEDPPHRDHRGDLRASSGITAFGVSAARRGPPRWAMPAAAVAVAPCRRRQCPAHRWTSWPAPSRSPAASPEPGAPLDNDAPPAKWCSPSMTGLT